MCSKLATCPPTQVPPGRPGCRLRLAAASFVCSSCHSQSSMPLPSMGFPNGLPIPPHRSPTALFLPVVLSLLVHLSRTSARPPLQVRSPRSDWAPRCSMCKPPFLASACRFIPRMSLTDWTSTRKEARSPLPLKERSSGLLWDLPRRGGGASLLGIHCNTATVPPPASSPTAGPGEWQAGPPDPRANQVHGDVGRAET